jgi:hypothetical protein
MLSDSGHLCGNREFLSAAHARGNITGGREQGCGLHDTPLSHMGEGSAFVGVAKVVSCADETRRLVLKSKDSVLRLR